MHDILIIYIYKYAKHINIYIYIVIYSWNIGQMRLLVRLDPYKCALQHLIFADQILELQDREHHHRTVKICWAPRKAGHSQKSRWFFRWAEPLVSPGEHQEITVQIGIASQGLGIKAFKGRPLRCSKSWTHIRKRTQKVPRQILWETLKQRLLSKSTRNVPQESPSQ